MEEKDELLTLEELNAQLIPQEEKDEELMTLDELNAQLVKKKGETGVSPTKDTSLDSEKEQEGAGLSDVSTSEIDTNAFKAGIHNIESKGKKDPYKALNPKSSATGKYQFLWKEHGDRIKKETGVKTQKEFLDSPEAQEKFMDSWVSTTLKPEAQKLRDSLPEQSKKYSNEELMALVHFQGLSDAKEFLKTGDTAHADINATVKGYLEKFNKGMKGAAPKKVVTEKGDEGVIRQPFRETDAIPGFVGMVIRNAPIIGDFVDDMYRSITTGLERGQSVPDATNLLLQGKDVSKKDIENYIKVVQESEAAPTSQEMMDFQKVIEKEGDNWYGFFKAIYKNPTVAPLVMAESLASMINASSASAAAGTLATGTTLGGVSGGIPGAGMGFMASIPFAFGAAGATLESAMSFTEFLKEELQNKKLKFDPEGIKKVLEDEEAFNKIRNRAVGRGATIGVIDALGGKLAASVGAKMIGRGVGATTKAKAATTVLGIEAASGGVGETTARAVVGQKMSPTEIGLETIGELPGGGVTLPLAFFEAPSYKINGEAVSKNEVEKFINTATLEELSQAKVDINNDEQVKAQYYNKESELNKKQELQTQFPNIAEEKVSEIVALEMEASKLEGSKTESSKIKRQEILTKIKELIKEDESAVAEEAVDEVDAIAEEFQNIPDDEIKVFSVESI